MLLGGMMDPVAFQIKEKVGSKKLLKRKLFKGNCKPQNTMKSEQDDIF